MIDDNFSQTILISVYYQLIRDWISVVYTNFSPAEYY